VKFDLLSRFDTQRIRHEIAATHNKFERRTAQSSQDRFQIEVTQVTSLAAMVRKRTWGLRGVRRVLMDLDDLEQVSA
jgi:hypothetical protein